MIESSKAANEIYSPVSGVINEINSQVTQQPQIIGKSPMLEGSLSA